MVHPLRSRQVIINKLCPVFRFWLVYSWDGEIYLAQLAQVSSHLHLLHFQHQTVHQVVALRSPPQGMLVGVLAFDACLYQNCHAAYLVVVWIVQLVVAL